MPLYNWGKKWEKILVSNVSQSTLIRASRIGLFPSSSICHFLYLNLNSLLSGSGVSRGSVEATAPWWPPTPSHQTFLARMAFTTRGIHAAGNHTNMKSTQQLAPSNVAKHKTDSCLRSYRCCALPSKGRHSILTNPLGGRFCSCSLLTRNLLEAWSSSV